MDLLTFISDMDRRRRLAEACGTTPGYLWQIANRWEGRKPSAKLATLIEQESAKIGPEAVPRGPLIFGADEPLPPPAQTPHLAAAEGRWDDLAPSGRRHLVGCSTSDTTAKPP